MKLCRFALYLGDRKGRAVQENGGHGWFALMPRNNYVGCIGESSSWHDAVSGTASNHEAANWYISSWASDCTFTGVRSDNPYGPSQEVPLERILASLWGFYFEGSVRRLNIIGANAYDQCHMDYEDNNKPKPKALEGAWKFSIENPLKQACKIEIIQYAYTSNETAEKKLNPEDYPLKK